MKGFFTKLFKWFVKFFKSDMAQGAINKAIDLVPEVLPVVQTIAAMTPNRTDDELTAAFHKYAVPFLTEYRQTPVEQRGYLLLHLATRVLAARYPTTATSVLNTAVQLAVLGTKNL